MRALQSLLRFSCKNCHKQLGENTQSNFCSQECFDEWMGKQLAHAISFVAYGVITKMRET